MLLQQTIIDKYLQSVNHASFKFASIAEFLKKIHIKNYVYARYYHDGRFFVLHQDGSIMQAALEYLDLGHYRMAKNLYQKYAWGIWNDFNIQATEFIQYLEDRDLMNNCSVVINEQDHIEVHEFYGSHQHSHLGAFYAQRRSLLYAFINHFKVKYGTTIEQLASKAAPIILDDTATSCSPSNENNMDDFKAPFLTETRAITHQRQLYVLSKREYQMLQHFQKGWSLKAIARHCHISPRTVETYLNRIKHKLNIHGKTALFEIDIQL